MTPIKKPTRVDVAPKPVVTPAPKPAPAPVPKASPLSASPIVALAKAAMNTPIKASTPVGGGPTEPFNQAKADQIKKMITGMPIPPSTPPAPKSTFVQADDTAGIGKPIPNPTLAQRQALGAIPKTLPPGFSTSTIDIEGIRKLPPNPAMYKKGGEAKKYTKGGKINLDACGVSTHQKSKKSSSW